jgi:hypothetical protein
MPERSSREYERLVNELDDKPRWSDEDATFVLEIMNRPAPGDPPAHAAHLVIPADDAPTHEVEEFLKLPGADDAIQWHFDTFAYDMAWAIVNHRLVSGQVVPERLRLRAREEWSRMLNNDDLYARVRGATSLISTGLFKTDPHLEMKIEAMRRGDPSADVRAAIERRLAYYDRVHNGVEPSGPTSECNTCP